MDDSCIYCEKKNFEGLMICCDRCEVWYHHKCVYKRWDLPLPKRQVRYLLKYYCYPCRRANPSLKLEYYSSDNCLLIISQLERNARSLRLSTGGGGSSGSNRRAAPPPPTPASASHNNSVNPLASPLSSHSSSSSSWLNHNGSSSSCSSSSRDGDNDDDSDNEMENFKDAKSESAIGIAQHPEPNSTSSLYSKVSVHHQESRPQQHPQQQQKPIRQKSHPILLDDRGQRKRANRPSGRAKLRSKLEKAMRRQRHRSRACI